MGVLGRGRREQGAATFFGARRRPSPLLALSPLFPCRTARQSRPPPPQRLPTPTQSGSPPGPISRADPATYLVRQYRIVHVSAEAGPQFSHCARCQPVLHRVDGARSLDEQPLVVVGVARPIENRAGHGDAPITSKLEAVLAPPRGGDLVSRAIAFSLRAAAAPTADTTTTVVTRGR